MVIVKKDNKTKQRNYKGGILRAVVRSKDKCWFSKIYGDYTVKIILERDPEYIIWCHENLRHLRFSDQIKRKINKHKNLKVLTKDQPVDVDPVK